MSDPRARDALARIERALDRIDSAAGGLPDRADDGDLERLREIHQAFRGKVEGAISQIDHLLATEERH